MHYFQKVKKKWKKMLTKGWVCDNIYLTRLRNGGHNLSKAVRTGFRVFEAKNASKKTWKKFLTKAFRCVILIKLLLIRNGSAVKKLWKKYLTNEMKFGMISKLRRMRRVPCKLNNVTKRKHQTEQFFMNWTKKLPSTRLSQLRGTVTIKMKLWQIAR